MEIYSGKNYITLKDIIEKLGNKNYDFIEVRCRWTDKNGQMQDIFFGGCSYKDGVLISLDGDTYSLNDLYDDYKEFTNDGKTCLTVWENCYMDEGRKIGKEE